MRHIAIVGSGPAGFYTAEALLKSGEVAIDILDRMA
jgi:ferredoxin--NADP+ reductase